MPVHSLATHEPAAARPPSLEPAVSLLPHSSAALKFHLLPAELRLRIWSCAAEPRLVLLDELLDNVRSYPLPSVAQLNFEARVVSREGYEPIGRGSHLHFARDILVCGPDISDHSPSKSLTELASRIRRLAFWDCFPDDGRVLDPHRYSTYVTAFYQQRRFGHVEFSQFLFPNLEDLWIVKVGDVDRSWRVAVHGDQPYEVRLRRSARQFRYWVDEDIIEIGTLDLDDPETKLVLRDGCCGRRDCQELNRGRNKMISKITFMDGKYQQSPPEENWTRILPWSPSPGRGNERDTIDDRMRWIMVERILTFSLHLEAEDERTTARSRTQATTSNRFAG